jgi:hypothetical protein
VKASIGAIPTIDNAIPKTPDISPFSKDFPDKLAIIVRENIATEKYSTGVNFNVTDARYGDINISAKMLICPPRKEYNIPTPNAFPASPLSAMGPPSKTVAIEDGVPGIFNKIAEINPPEIPPKYSPTKRAIPFIGIIPKDMGKNNTTAIVADNPGIEPKIIPITTPNKIRTRHMGFITNDNASKIICDITPLKFKNPIR